MTMAMATARPRQAGTISARMFILTVLISLAIIAQNGRTVYAVQIPPAGADTAVVRANANGGAGAGRSGTAPQRHSPSSRLEGNADRLLADSTTSTEATTTADATTEATESTAALTEDEIAAEEELVTEAFEDVSEAVEEKIESGEPITPENEENLVEAMEELNELAEETAEAAGAQEVLAALANETDPEAIVFPEEEEAVTVATTAYPEETEEETTTVAATEIVIHTQGNQEPCPYCPHPHEDGCYCAPEQHIAAPETTEAPPPEEVTTASTTPATTTSGDEEDVKDEEEGTPLTYESGTLSPTPAKDGGEWDWEKEEEGSIVPTPAEDGGEWDYGSPYERYPTEPPSPRPTSLYVPKDGDPLATEEEPDIEAFGDDVFYHGLGGTVGAYLDGVESPQDMEKDKNVQIVAGTLAGLFMVMMLVTAHLVMHYPDGLCAGCCRLTLKCICCFIRTLCLPCRAICCKGSDQTQGRRTHAPMRTPFPTDLELA